MWGENSPIAIGLAFLPAFQPTAKKHIKTQAKSNDLRKGLGELWLLLCTHRNYLHNPGYEKSFARNKQKECKSFIKTPFQLKTIVG